MSALQVPMIQFAFPRASVLSILVLVLPGCFAPDVESPVYQLMGGVTQYDDFEFEARSTTDPALTAKTDVNDQFVVGGVQQWVLTEQDEGEERFVDLGLEAGVLFSWEGDRSVARTGNGGTFVALDNDVFIADLFGGGIVSTEILEEKLRLYVAGGPLLYYAYLEADFEDETGERDDEFDSWSLGAYVRAGAELQVIHDGFVGIGVRVLKTEADFDELGEVDVEGVQWFITYTVKL